jgi:hypothetical protein
MPLPETISVRYTDEAAGYVSMRPVVKQTFRLHELADLIVSVTGKDAARVQQLLRTGTLLYNGYRYWFQSLNADETEVRALIAAFPQDEPARPFEWSQVVTILYDTGGGAQRSTLEISRDLASKKRLFAKKSPWDVLGETVQEGGVRYQKYAHGRRADLYRLALTYEKAQYLLEKMRETAPRALRHRWSTLKPASTLTCVCPR